MSNVLNYALYNDAPHGFKHLEIEHNGKANWAELQAVKDEVWGVDAIAFEIYPPADQVVNGNSTEFHFRHLFLAPAGFEWPNIRPE